MKETFDITGMTCASCSARVQKAASAVDGVSQASVNLLKNSLEVDYDGAAATADAVVAAVEKAGYGATPRHPHGPAAPAAGGTHELESAENASQASARSPMVPFIFLG